MYKREKIKVRVLNQSLHRANIAKNDEFYTQLTDIEKELRHYKEHLKNKVIFLNCDDPEESNFWKYFALNFKFLGLKKLIATHFETEKPSYKLEKSNGDTIKTRLKQNGDFRSP
ncbi:modification methylase, partial [Candidatus Woesearchaeota archaeon]|nr:modification methylase [Candidatus Woesearchaeota archaeon]